MSRYLQIAVGAGLYLLDASHVVTSGGGGDASPTVDLRALFEERAAAPGTPIPFAQASGPPAVLIADRVDGVAEYDEAEFCPLPPIGPIGALIDAVVTRSSDERPALRLRGEHALAAAAAID